jgi:hypothetical protein
MQFPTSLKWFRRLILLGAVVAAATASTAAAAVLAEGGRPVAVQGATALGLKADGMRLQGMAEVYKSLANGGAPTAQGLRAEGLRLTGIAQVYQQLQQPAAPDVFERYAAVHAYGAGTSQQTSLLRGGAGDFTNSVRTPIATTAGDRIVDDSFRDAPTVVASPATGNGLDWGDFGIGAGAMLGLAILAAGLGVGAVAARHHRTGKLGTS